jgi:two-component system cell cycle sensor histidine kinase/response regulator CckA
MADGEQDSSQRAEEAYETWQRLFESVPEAIAVQQANGRLLDVNEAMVEMYGYAKHELIGQMPVMLAAPDMVDLEATNILLAEAFAGEPQTFVWWGRRKNGEVFPNEVMLNRGRFFGQDVVIAMARDISDRFARQQALAESEARYRATFEAASDGLVIVDAPSGEVRSVNPRATELLERSRKQMRGVPLTELLIPADGDEGLWDDLWMDGDAQSLAGDERPRSAGDAPRLLAQAIAETGSHGSLLSGWCMRTSTGELRWIDLGFTRFHEGDYPRVLISMRDVTERRRASEILRAMEERQRLAERLRALGELAAGVAHNFNNALTSVLAHAQMLSRRRDLPADAVEDMKVIERVAREAAVTVRRIQTFARARDREEFEVVDIEDIVGNAVALTRPRWEPPEAPGRWQVDWKPQGEPLMVDGNAAEMCEVIVNLVLNAVDAMPRGGRLGLRCGVEGDRVFVEVRDTGVGIDEATQRRLFDPFFSTKGRHGHGLGLSVSHGIVRRHAGEITVISKPGEGSTFTVWFPRALETRGVTEAPIREVGPATILLVDDEAAVRGAVAQILAELGHTVHVASGGREALRMLDEHRDVTLLLTDLSMPGMDGSRLIREAKRRWPGLRTMLMTGLAADADSALLALADHLMRKPIEIGTLQRSLGLVLPPRVSAT